MPIPVSPSAIREFQVLSELGSVGGKSDAELLRTYQVDQGRAGEWAFRALVDRHGPMVHRTCYRILNHRGDADDAFQATFLVLSRRAGTIWVPGSIAPWLHGVANRIATRARLDRDRRHQQERRLAIFGREETVDPEIDDVSPLLHAEIARLPDRYQAPIILCYLEGLTHDQAANQLQWPVGTVRSRLGRGRARLRTALERRGVSLAPSALACLLKAPLQLAHRLSPSVTETAVSLSNWASVGRGMAKSGPILLEMSAFLTRLTLGRIAKLFAWVLAAGVLVGGTAQLALRDAPNSFGVEAITTHPPQTPAPGTSLSKAELIATRILNEGALHFNAKEASWLASTFTENGTLRLLGREQDQEVEETRTGRGEIEEFYTTYFRDKDVVTSRNTVEYARLITPGMLVIHGHFRPDEGQKSLPFVQLREHQNGQWLIRNLWLFLHPALKEHEGSPSSAAIRLPNQPAERPRPASPRAES